MSGYHEKMEELGTREARDNWCLKVESELDCSTEEREDGVHPGLRRVRKLEHDILVAVSLRSAFLSVTKYIIRLSRLFGPTYPSSPALSPHLQPTLCHEQHAV